MNWPGADRAMRWVVAVACLALVIAPAARGADEETATTGSAAAPGVVSSEPLLMAGLDRSGFGQWMTQNRINAFGWVEGSYNFNFQNPSPRLNVGHLFEVQDDDFVINQLELNVERLVTPSRDAFDVGGRIDLLYGSDARFIHSSGMFTGSFPDPQYQFDIPQLYVDVAVPVGNGLRLRLGKFEFFKFTDPNASPVFSHTFFYDASGESNNSRLSSSLVGASLPFTLTGITAAYQFNSQLNVEVGIGRGYDQTFTDNNSAVDGFGRVNWDLPGQTQASFALISGPEISADESHYRTSCDLGIVHAVSENFLILFDACFGEQARGQALFVPGTGLVAIGGNARWYGANATAVYRINRRISVAGRVEWYRDEEGFTTGLGSANLYEVTAGLTIMPFPDNRVGRGLKIRPEIRYDWIDAHSAIAGLIPNHQWIAGVDLIYDF